MKSIRSSIQRAVKQIAPAGETTARSKLAYIPGPPRVTRSAIRKAVQAVIKARLEKERGRPVLLSELKRDRKLPEVLVRGR